MSELHGCRLSAVDCKSSVDNHSPKARWRALSRLAVGTSIADSHGVDSASITDRCRIRALVNASGSNRAVRWATPNQEAPAVRLAGVPG